LRPSQSELMAMANLETFQKKTTGWNLLERTLPL
jgi:hypothetical protein